MERLIDDCLRSEGLMIVVFDKKVPSWHRFQCAATIFQYVIFSTKDSWFYRVDVGCDQTLEQNNHSALAASNGIRC